MRRIAQPGYPLVGALVLLVAPWAAGCGNKSQANADGGDGSVTFPDAPVLGRRAFDVVAVLRADGGVSNLPPTNIFTLIVDPEAKLAIAGANGRGGIVGVTSVDGRTFHSAGTFRAGVADGSACSGASEVVYTSFAVTIADGSLTGTANGAAQISCGDCVFTVPFGATLTGTADATPPTLRSAGFIPANPFDTLGLVASEPLPAGTTARLVADDGEAIDLIPTVVDGVEPLVLGFTKPEVVLRAGQGYAVTLDGLVDFAGLTDRSGTPLRVASFQDAPAVPEDGFESATGSVLGGAMVMTAGALPPIAGNTSLYFGNKGAPGLDSAAGRTLMVRLPRQAGDTKLRFSYRVVGPAEVVFSGFMRVGSEGASAGSPMYSFASAMASQMITVAGQTAYVSAVTTSETALPADATDDVLLVIGPLNFACGNVFSTSAGLLIDDLRLE